MNWFKPGVHLNFVCWRKGELTYTRVCRPRRNGTLLQPRRSWRGLEAKCECLTGNRYAMENQTSSILLLWPRHIIAHVIGCHDD